MGGCAKYCFQQKLSQLRALCQVSRVWGSLFPSRDLELLVLSFPEWRRTNFVMARCTFSPVICAGLKSMWNSNYSSAYQQLRLIPDVTIDFQVTQLLWVVTGSVLVGLNSLFKASFQGSWTLLCFDASTFCLGVVSREVSIEMWSWQVIKWQRQGNQGFAKDFSLQSAVGNALSLIHGAIQDGERETEGCPGWR